MVPERYEERLQLSISAGSTREECDQTDDECRHGNEQADTCNPFDIHIVAFPPLRQFSLQNRDVTLKVGRVLIERKAFQQIRRRRSFDALSKVLLQFFTIEIERHPRNSFNPAHHRPIVAAERCVHRIAELPSAIADALITLPQKGPVQRIWFAYFESDKDAMAYQGFSLTRGYIEEVGQFVSLDPMWKLMATLRSTAGVKCQMRMTANPGGPSPLRPSWSYFVDNGPDRIVRDPVPA